MKTVAFNMRMSQDTKSKLAAIADTFGVPRSQVIDILIDTAHKKLEIANAADANPAGGSEPTAAAPGGGDDGQRAAGQ